MSENEQEAAIEAAVSGADPAAMTLALNSAHMHPGIAEDARAFLRNQSALITDQRHHLHEQLKQVHLSIWEKWLGVLLRVATALMGLGIAAGLGFMGGRGCTPQRRLH